MATDIYVPPGGDTFKLGDDLTIDYRPKTAGPAPATGLPIRINCGGGAFRGWLEDTPFVTGGTTVERPEVWIDGGGHIARLYLNERWGDQTYIIPVPDGHEKVSVRLHFCETYGDGSRDFDVEINGMVISGLNPMVQAGKFKVMTRTIGDVAVENGKVVVYAHGRAAFLNGIEIDWENSMGADVGWDDPVEPEPEPEPGPDPKPKPEPEPTPDGAPAPARDFGLTRLEFSSEFDTMSKIDLDGSPDSKTLFTQVRKGNIFTCEPMAERCFTQKDGHLDVAPDRNKYQINFSSSWPLSGKRYGGYAMTGTGWYVEGRFRHKKASMGKGFLAFWSMDLRHVYNWGGLPEGLTLEPDFYECINGRDYRCLHAHTWSGPRKSTINNTSMPAGAPEDWFTVGFLYHPDGNIASWYMNGKRVFVRSDSFIRLMRTGTFPIFFGSGPAQPYDVDWIRVWR